MCYLLPFWFLLASAMYCVTPPQKKIKNNQKELKLFDRTVGRLLYIFLLDP